ncbi:alpha/beta hydrolase [Carboxylicivirga sediminis]|uniref:Alpha/beta hydrolase n=1 Tax=Carboxylicivirga sediminis TaxID=2006564 RepID=A0A941IU10_9BACT|nr:dienelactone hydrolase family protein [Carboxylicivirga sediminis]MBR8534090.1 alpha/beta hydrolase [Carboxylicivirga sediminis]
MRVRKSIIIGLFWALTFGVGINAQNSFFNPEVPDVVQYEVTPDVKYGEGKVNANGKVAMKDLTMDVYYPKGESSEPRPAVILTYGGSFHRGNPRSSYTGFGGQTTSMSQYAMRYAAEGFVVFTVNYRVAPDNPIVDEYSGYTEDDIDVSIFTNPAAVAQTNMIRQQMGLEALTNENAEDVLKAAVLAAGEDLRTAIRHIKAESDVYQINPDKIALGGFSAGAVTSINVAYGMQEKVSAVFTNSGFVAGLKIDNKLATAESNPPIMLFMSDNDYPVVTFLTQPLIQILKANAVEYHFNWVPGFGHFYPGGAVTLSDTGDKIPLIERTLGFLKEKLQ